MPAQAVAVTRLRRLPTRVSDAEASSWGYQRPGPYPFWFKVSAWYEQNRTKEPRVEPTSDTSLAEDLLHVGNSTISRWRSSGYLPPVDFCIWLADQMGMSLHDLLNPEVEYGTRRGLRERVVETLERQHPQLAEFVMKALLENPRAVGALALLGGAPQPPR